MKRFVLLSTQRTGSTFLRIWLNSHSQINSHGEVFLADYRAPDGFRKYCLDTSVWRSAVFFLRHTRFLRRAGNSLITRSTINAYLNKLFCDPSHPAPWTDIDQRDEFTRKQLVQVTGFKLMYGTLERRGALQDWLDDQPDMMFIHLVRNNLLKSYISAERMRLSGVAHTKDESFAYSPVSIDIPKLINYFETTTSKRRFYRQKYSTGRPYLELTYEGIVTDQAVTMQKILDFFSLQSEPMPLPTMKKISSAEIKNEITNHQEVIDRLSGTTYEIFLSDFVC
jgi:LPS sulfotransferase NodH